MERSLYVIGERRVTTSPTSPELTILSIQEERIVTKDNTVSYGAICPFDGKSCFLVLPLMNQDWMVLMLQEMAQRYLA